MRKRRIFTIASCVSALILLALLGASLTNCDRWPPSSEPTGLPLWRDVRIGAYGGWFCVFNRENPYQRNLLFLPSERQIIKGFEGPGIYYWWFQFKDRSTYWTFSLWKVYPIALAAVMPSIWLYLRARRAKKTKPERATPTS
jgi:hypothetical protein